MAVAKFAASFSIHADENEEKKEAVPSSAGNEEEKEAARSGEDLDYNDKVVHTLICGVGEGGRVQGEAEEV